jgi:hypothetical protein
MLCLYQLRRYCNDRNQYWLCENMFNQEVNNEWGPNTPSTYLPAKHVSSEYAVFEFGKGTTHLTLSFAFYPTLFRPSGHFLWKETTPCLCLSDIRTVSVQAVAGTTKRGHNSHNSHNVPHCQVLMQTSGSCSGHVSCTAEVAALAIQAATATATATARFRLLDATPCGAVVRSFQFRHH